jgi:hypothetical protein
VSVVGNTLSPSSRKKKGGENGEELSALLAEKRSPAL